MIFNVIGKAKGTYTNRETKEMSFYVRLYVTRSMPDVEGLGCDTLSIYSNREQLYDRARDVKVGSVLSVDYNNRGYIESFDVLQEDQKK